MWEEGNHKGVSRSNSFFSSCPLISVPFVQKNCIVHTVHEKGIMYWCTVDSLFKWGHEKLIAYSSLRSFDLWIVRYNCNSILGGKFIKWLRFCRTESETSISNITNPNYKYIFTAEILNGLRLVLKFSYRSSRIFLTGSKITFYRFWIKNLKTDHWI